MAATTLGHYALGLGGLALLRRWMEHGADTEVRGPGLFLGVELPDADEASGIHNEMRNRGVLIGLTGPGHNVLKIRPPLVFEPRHADILLEALDDSIRSV